MGEVDKTGLEDRAFDAFASTSKRNYLYLSNLKTRVTRWSKRAVEDFGLESEYFVDSLNVWGSRIHPDDRKAYYDDLSLVLSGEKERHYQTYRILNKEGEYITVTCRGVVVKGENGEPDLFAGSVVNHGIADNIDQATGLENVYSFIKALSIVLRNRQSVGMIMIGINHFGDIDDVYGYKFGNAVLKAFADMLKDVLGARGMIFRLDGVKFMLGIYSATKEELEGLFAEIVEKAKKGLVVNGNIIPLSLSAGAIVKKCENIDRYSLVASMKYALAKSKGPEHGRLVFVDDVVQNHEKEVLQIVTLVRRSVLDECEGFYLKYQPINNARTGEVIGAEALVRWHNETLGEVGPNDFIPVLENDSCFYELGLWILHRALNDMLSVVKQNPYFVLNVNVSCSQIENVNFRGDVLKILEEENFPAENLCLEITERCRSLDKGLLKNTIEFFRAHKIKVAIDDFGTGISALGMLKDLMVDNLKIDRTFIKDICDNETSQAIVESVIVCARKLGVQVCAEGVENKKLKEYLGNYKLNSVQGYLYSKPVPLSEFKNALVNRNFVK